MCVGEIEPPFNFFDGVFTFSYFKFLNENSGSTAN